MKPTWCNSAVQHWDKLIMVIMHRISAFTVIHRCQEALMSRKKCRWMQQYKWRLECSSL